MKKALQDNVLIHRRTVDEATQIFDTGNLFFVLNKTWFGDKRLFRKVSEESLIKTFKYQNIKNLTSTGKSKSQSVLR